LSPKRKDHVAPPSVNDEWHVRFGTTDAAKGWDELCRQARGNTRGAFEAMRSNPRPNPTDRHHRLRGDLGKRTVEGETLEQWQIEVTGGGRIWYAVDDNRRTVWIVHAGPGHPKATDS